MRHLALGKEGQGAVFALSHSLEQARKSVNVLIIIIVIIIIIKMFISRMPIMQYFNWLRLNIKSYINGRTFSVEPLKSLRAQCKTYKENNAK